MHESQSGGDTPSVEQGWVEVGRAPAPGVLGDAPPDDEPRPFESPQGTPPWKLSLYTGVAGLVIMAALLVFPELRVINTPWDSEFPVALAILVIPTLSIIWGVVGAVGPRYRADARRALSGIVISLVAVGLGYVVLTGDAGVNAPHESGTVDERLQMTPQQLREWRNEKLRQ